MREGWREGCSKGGNNKWSNHVTSWKRQGGRVTPQVGKSIRGSEPCEVMDVMVASSTASLSQVYGNGVYDGIGGLGPVRFGVVEKVSLMS